MVSKLPWLYWLKTAIPACIAKDINQSIVGKSHTVWKYMTFSEILRFINLDDFRVSKTVIFI